MKIDDIRLVEMELHSKCNRQCPWCPNSYIDRHSSNTFMEDELFKNIIDELSEHNYSGHISFSRYNEPFMYPNKLRDKVNYIKNKLPNAKLVCNSNGDYDMTDFTDDIQITEMDYDGNKICYISEDNNYRVMRLGPINNRAGALEVKAKERNFPCYEPFYFVGVDYTGDVTPCCSVRHDVKIHQPYILGNINNNSLEEILNTDKAVKFRNNVKNKDFPDVCKYCTKTEGRYTRDNPGIE